MRETSVRAVTAFDVVLQGLQGDRIGIELVVSKRKQDVDPQSAPKDELRELRDE